MPHLSQITPTLTVVPTAWRHGYVPTPGTATAAEQINPHPVAWPYTGGIYQYGIGPGPVVPPVSPER